MDKNKPADQRQQLIRAIDYFVHADLHRNPDLLSRARFLALNLVGGIALYIVTLAMAWIFALQTMHLTVPVTVANLLMALYLLHRLRHSGSYTLCGVWALLQGWTAIVAVTVITGGPFASASVVQLLSLPCVIAFFLGGNYWGVAMALLSLVTVSFMALMQWSGVPFPQLASTTEFPFAQSFLLPINLALMTALSVVYEVTYVSVKRQRDTEHQKYLQLAATDPLTGLANRRMFDETLSARIDLYSKLAPVRRFALCYLDLDKFKPINDQFGHNVGDEVLNAISSRLRLALRGADFVGRHGGDEFLLLLDSVQDAAAAQALAKRFLQLIQEPVETSVGAMQVGGSFGFALFPDHGADMATLQKAADAAMYEAKREHSGYQIFRPQ